jgi:hypothetical protein
MIEDTLLDLIFVGTLLTFGLLATRIILRSEKFFQIVPFAFPIGSGIFSWVLFLISWMGVLIRPVTVLGVGFVLVSLSGAFIGWKIKSGSGQKVSDHERPSNSILKKAPIMVPLMGLFIVSMLLSIGRSYSTWDSIAIWSIKGYGIAREGTIFAGEQWGAHGLNYPQNIPLVIASFTSLGGDFLPGSKMIFPIFYISLVIGGYQFWRRMKVRGSVAGLGVLFIASIPVVVEHSTIGYVNLPFATYVALGCVLAIAGVIDGDSNMQFASGVLLGLAVWTRPEGVFLIPILILGLFLALKLVQPQPVRIVPWVLPIIIIGSTWILFLSKYGGQGQLSSGIQHLIQLVRNGQFPWDVLPIILRTLLRHAITFKNWGLVLPTALLMIVLNYRKFQPKDYPHIFALMAPMFLTGIAMVFFYVLGSFDGDLSYMMDTGLDRMFLPFIILTAVWTILLAGVPRVERSIHCS